MAQRPMVRPDSAETRANHQSPPTSETKPQQRNEALDGYSDPSAESNSALDDVLKLVAEQACLATSASACAIALAQEGAMVCRAAAGPHAPEVGMRLNIDSGLTGACVHTGQVQYCEDTESDSRVNAEVCHRLQVRSVLVLPLHHEGVLLGIIEIFSPFPQAFAPHDLDNLEALSRVVLENIRPAPERVFPARDLAQPEPPENAEPTVELSEAWEIEASKPLNPSTPPLELSAIRWEPPEAASVTPVLPPQVQEFLEPAPPKSPPAPKPPPPAPPIAREQPHPPHYAPQAESRTTAPVSRPAQTASYQGAAAVAPKREAAVPQAESRAATPQAQARAPQPASRQEMESPRPPLANPVGRMSPPQNVVPPPPRHRDWPTGLLTITVVAVALLLGWMLGRAGWQRMMGQHSSALPTTVAAASPRPSAETSNPYPDPAAVLPGSPVKPAPKTTSHAPAQAPAARDNSQKDGGLVVYDGGTIIFRQSARRSATGKASDVEDGELQPEAAPGDPVSLSPEVASQYLTRRVDPVYPEDARLRNISGAVSLEAVVGKDGTVQMLRLISGNSQLAQAAADAVRQWRFRPYKAGGKAQEFSTRLTVTFRLH